MGTNQNYASRSGTAYHVQVEDRGPVFDDATEGWVRRVNLIVYANYGEPTARIVYARDHDLPDVRTHENNRSVALRIQELAGEARRILEEREERQVQRLKGLLERYYRTRDEKMKLEIEEANALFPFVFARAFQELKAARAGAPEAAAGQAPPAGGEAPPPAGPEAEAAVAEPEETVYPLDAAQRDLVLEIERVSEELRRDLAALRERGAADDILQATCAKLLARAKDSLRHQDSQKEFAARYLGMTRNSLVTAYRQVRARLTRLGG
jgi:flagellar motility protein MotE (MotC chaperone)